MGRTKGSGAGSVYKRGNKWRGQIIVDGERLSFTADKKKDVLDWFAKVRNEPIIKSQDYTVEDWFETYFEKYFRPRVRDNTYNGATCIIKHHLYPVLGDVKLQDLTTDKIQSAIPKIFPKEYSSGMYRQFKTRLIECLDYAVKENIIRKNPAVDIVMPKNDTHKKVEAFTKEEQKKIVEYCRGSNEIDRVYYFLVATGVRVGEAICLTWGDVNLEEGYIDINKTAVKTTGGIIVQPHPKTGQSNRRIYLSKKTVCFLQRLEGINEITRGSLVLPNRNGNIYNVSTLRQHWIRTCKKLKIPYKSMHALRHSWATRALEGGIDVQTVSKMLGHKSVATTMDIYQSVFSERKIEAAKTMNQFV